MNPPSQKVFLISREYCWDEWSQHCKLRQVNDREHVMFHCKPSGEERDKCIGKIRARRGLKELRGEKTERAAVWETEQASVVGGEQDCRGSKESQ